MLALTLRYAGLMAPHTIGLHDTQRALFRARREELALSQDEVDGVSAATVRNVENAYRDHFAVTKLADLAIGLSLSPADMREAGLPEVANRMERHLRRRDDFVREILNTIDQTPKNSLHLVACPPLTVGSDKGGSNVRAQRRMDRREQGSGMLRSGSDDRVHALLHGNRAMVETPVRHRDRV